jgi:dTDP-4-dehydrorhamnose 3,5-epimerase
LQFEPIHIPGAYRISLSPFVDDRGAFSRLFCSEEIAAIGHTAPIVQVNHSLNKEKGTVRGMHFQYPPHAEVKIIRCLRGSVFDVMVDLRPGSPTFLKWYGIELTPEAFNMIYIPEGCAHGFQTLQPDTELLYFHTAAYNKRSEGGVLHNDPMIGIDWPLPAVHLSEKDKHYPLLTPDFNGVMPFSLP